MITGEDIEAIWTVLEPRIRQLVGQSIQKTGNTPKEAAPKLGICARQVCRLMRRRLIEFIDEGPRSRFITDAAIERFKQKRTRRAIS